MEERLLKFRLSLMVFLQYAAWGSYQISLGIFLAGIGYGSRIAWFYAAQGVSALFMPAIMGRIADRHIPAQRLFMLCHFISAAFFAVMALESHAVEPGFKSVFIPYLMGILVFVPTISLCNTICFAQLSLNGMDSQKDFPIIRMWGTVGFIVSMLAVNFMGIAADGSQFTLRAVLGAVLAFYAMTLPACPIHGEMERGARRSFGRASVRLFKDGGMAAFYILCMLFGICLHMSNGFTGAFLDSFSVFPEYAGSRFVGNSMLVMSLSQISEALCVLLLPFCLKRFGVRRVLMVSALAWTMRYLLLSWGNPGDRAWMLLLSMVMYGIAFDFFNISASIHIDRNTSQENRALGQGLMLVMTNGLGASIGMLGIQQVVNAFTGPQKFGDRFYTVGNWPSVWLLFAVFSAVLLVLVLAFFKERKKE